MFRGIVPFAAFAVATTAALKLLKVGCSRTPLTFAAGAITAGSLMTMYEDKIDSFKGFLDSGYDQNTLVYQPHVYDEPLEVRTIVDEDGLASQLMYNENLDRPLYQIQSDGLPPTELMYQTLQDRLLSTDLESLPDYRRQTQEMMDTITVRIGPEQVVQPPVEDDNNTPYVPIALGISAIGAAGLWYGRNRYLKNQGRL